ncbi:reverse transcriptase, partial [Phytophthora megakarya]
MKGLRDGPVKTYIFREYPSTIEAAITLAMQEECSLRQDKLHTNVPCPPRPAAKTEGPEPMDLSYASAVGQHKKKGSNVRCFRCGNMGHYALTRVYNGQAVLRTAALSERESHCKVQDDMPNLVILKVTSMTKRADSLRVLVDSGASNNFVRQQWLPLLDFEEKHVPRSQLEVRLATGAIVKIEKRVIRARFSHKHRVFVEVLLVLDLDDKFDMVLGMPWLARHDPIIDWEKHSGSRRCLQSLRMERFAKDLEDTLSAETKKESFEEQSWDSLKSSPYYEILREHRDVLPDKIPAELPLNKGIQHEIDLVPGTKYCVATAAGASEGGWRIVHLYNKLDDSAIPAQTPIPRKDVIIDSMSKSTIYSALDLRDGFFPILMRESDIPLTAVITPSNASRIDCARCDFAPSYFDDVYVHSPAVNEKTDVEMHKEHLRELLGLMRKHKLYANLKKCIFGASEIPVLGYLIGKIGYVDNYACKIRPLSQLLKKEAAWDVLVQTAECQQEFDAVKLGLTEAPILAVADQDRIFTAVDGNADRIVVPNAPDLRNRIMDFYWNHQYKWVRKYVRSSATTADSVGVSMDFVFGLPRDSRRKTGIVVFVDRFSKMVHLAAVAAEVTSVQTARLFADMVFKHHGMPNDFVSDRDPRFTALFWQEMLTLLGTQFSMSTAGHPQTDGQTERVNRVLVDLLKSDYLPMAEFAINNAVHASTGHTPFFVNAMRHPRLPSTLGAVASSLTLTRQGDVSVPGTDTVKNNEQATPASSKDNVSVRGTDTEKTHAQAGPVARTSDVSMPGIDTEKLHAQAGPAAITHEMSVPGTGTTKSHAQSGTDVNTSGGYVQGIDADKVNDLDPGFSSQAMDFDQERQAVVRFVQDAIAVSADRQKLNADNVGRGITNEFEVGSLFC